jgi:hypothetical protein
LNWDYPKRLAKFNVIDPLDQFEFATYKWQKIANAINKNNHRTQPKIVSTCKQKWVVIYDNFKSIFDYMSSIGNNTKYLTPQKKTFQPSKELNKQIYEMIKTFMGVGLIFHPCMFTT